MKTLSLGTRGSKLAFWQANYIRKLLINEHPELHIEINVIRTKGDVQQKIPLPEIGGKGLFTKEIEDALLEDRIQLAVHSLKDLPTTLPDGLVFAGSPKRDDVRDTLISLKWKRLNDIPENGIIATGSIRRQVLIRNIKPNINLVDLRGNVDTRLRKLEANDWDGIIVASAALERMGKQELITEYLDPETFVPAVSQGAIGIEVNQKREDVLELIRSISDTNTVQAVLAERAFLRRLEGGCSVPIGAWGRVVNGEFILTGFVSSVDGSRQLHESMTGLPEDGESLGYHLADRFLSMGARELIHS